MDCRIPKMFAVVWCAVVSTLGLASAQAQNLITDLGVATGYAINNSGQAALSSGIFSNGTVTPLPALSGETTPATPIAINASGQASGFAISPNIDGDDPSIRYQ